MNLSSPQRRILLRESDIERRKLERQLAAGDPQARVRLLANQIRAGELDYRNLAVAAALGDPIAKQLGLEEPELNRRNFRLRIESSLSDSNLSHEEIVYFAADCAEQVLPVFEKEFPDDDRPRRAIEAARSMDRRAAYDAAYDAVYNVADDAAYDAAYAASAAAYAAWATYGAATYAAWAAYDAARAGLSEDWIIKRLIDYLLGRVQ